MTTTRAEDIKRSLQMLARTIPGLESNTSPLMERGIWALKGSHLMPSLSGAGIVFAKVNTPTESHHVETNWCGEGKVPKREPSKPRGRRQRGFSGTKQMEIAINKRKELKTLPSRDNSRRARKLQAILPQNRISACALTAECVKAEGKEPETILRTLLLMGKKDPLHLNCLGSGHSKPGILPPALAVRSHLIIQSRYSARWTRI